MTDREVIDLTESESVPSQVVLRNDEEGTPLVVERTGSAQATSEDILVENITSNPATRTETNTGEMGQVAMTIGNEANVKMDDDPDECESADQKLDESQDEGCAICFEPFTNSGSHRMASLKCGHLFGYACVERWLKCTSGKKRKTSGATAMCPQCKKSAKLSDIRIIFATKAKAIDTAERDRALEDLEKEKTARKQLEVQLAAMRQQLERTAAIAATSSAQQPSELPLHLSRPRSPLRDEDRTGPVQPAGPSPYVLLRDIKISELTTLDLSYRGVYRPLHQKPVKDVVVSPNNLLLTVSHDCFAKLTSPLSDATVQSYDLGAPGWSCAWHWSNEHQFFVGLLNGAVLLCDTRKSDGFLERLQDTGASGSVGVSRSPVVSLCSVQPDTARSIPGGLLVGQLDRVSFLDLTHLCANPTYENASGEDKPPALFTPLHPLQGSLTSLSRDPGSGLCLASFRPSKVSQNIRHQVFRLVQEIPSQANEASGGAVASATEGGLSCEVVRNFRGGTVQQFLTRSCLGTHGSWPGGQGRGVTAPGSGVSCAGADGAEALCVFAPDEASSSVKLWNVRSGSLLQSARLDCARHGPVLSALPFSVTVGVGDRRSQSLMACLHDKSLTILRT